MPANHALLFVINVTLMIFSYSFLQMLLCNVSRKLSQLARQKKKVLLVDLDPQCTLTSQSLGSHIHTLAPHIYSSTPITQENGGYPRNILEMLNVFLSGNRGLGALLPAMCLPVTNFPTVSICFCSFAHQYCFCTNLIAESDDDI